MKDPQQGSPFTNGRGPGRGMDIAEGRKAPKEFRRGVGDGDPVEIDLGALNQPGKGPVNYEPAKGWDLDQPLRKGGPDGDDDRDLNVA